MVKIKVIKDVIEELTLINEPYIMTPEEETAYRAKWENAVKVELVRGIDDHVGKWFRVVKYDRTVEPPRRFILDSVCGWKEFFKGDTFAWTSVFREED